MHKRSLIAVACLVALACIIAATNFVRAQTASAVDLTPRNCSITVNMPEGQQLDGLAFDVYQVAEAVQDPGFDAYTFKAVPALEGESGIDWANLGAPGTNAADSYKALAQIACGKTPLNPDAAQPSLTRVNQQPVPAGTAVEGLNAGLYLVIAHDASLAPEQYTIKAVDGDNVTYTTIALSPTKEYIFDPEIVAVPYKVGANGAFTTAGNDEWHYAVNGTLKPAEQPRYGSLSIQKNLLSFAVGHPADFVFQVDAYSDAERTNRVYSNVVRMSFEQAGQQAYLVEGAIPAGSYVTVTEVYSGLSYRPTTEGGNVVQLADPIVADPIDGVDPDSDALAAAEFTNDYDNGGNQGGSIVNNFTYGTPDDQSQRGRVDPQWIWSKE